MHRTRLFILTALLLLLGAGQSHAAEPPSFYRDLKPFLARYCLECHNAPEKFLRPRSEVFNAFYQPPDDQLAFSCNSVRQCTEPEVVVPVWGSMNAW